MDQLSRYRIFLCTYADRKMGITFVIPPKIEVLNMNLIPATVFFFLGTLWGKIQRIEQYLHEAIKERFLQLLVFIRRKPWPRPSQSECLTSL